MTPASSGTEDLVGAFFYARRRLLDACLAVPAAQRDRVIMGTWDLKDLLAHLAGWDYTNAEAVSDLLAGRLPSFYASYDKDWESFNALLVERYRLDDWDALLARVRDAQDAALAAFRSLSQEDLAQDRGVRWRGRPVTIAGILRAAARDEEVHGRQVLDFARTSA